MRMKGVSEMDYDELVDFIQALDEVAAARKIEAEYDLEGMDADAIREKMIEVSARIDAMEEAELAEMNRAYEASQ